MTTAGKLMFFIFVLAAGIQLGSHNYYGSRALASADKFAHLTEVFQKEVDTKKIPGAVLIIQQHGRPIYLKSFGVRDVKTKLPMTPDTIFALHSMTKPITAVAVMMLIDEGKLALTDPLAKYLPEFANVKVGVETMDEAKKPFLKLVPPHRPVTIADMLRHTSGITYEYIGGELIRHVYTEANLLEGDYDNKVFAHRIAGLPLSCQPGTLWRYGRSTDVIGRVIEVISGESLYQFEKKRILDPLGMTSTKYHLTDPVELSRMAEPFPEDAILVGSEDVRRRHPKWESAGGGLVSTITDYANFSQMILNGGQLNGRRFVSAKSFKEMTTDHIGPETGVERDYDYYPGDGFGYGYGFGIRTDPGQAVPPPVGNIGELKWDSGSGTYFGIDPKLDMFYILMVQTNDERSRLTPLFKQLVYEGFR